MTERSIILPGADVRAILDGQKTQVRVVVPKQPKPYKGPGVYSVSCGRGKWTTNERLVVVHDAKTNRVIGSKEILLPLEEWLLERSPVKAGSRLWVRETWQRNFSGHVSHCGLLYRATAATDQSWHGYWAKELDDGTWVDHYDRPFKWRSASSMPRPASRLTLEVTDVKVEQVDGRWWWVYTIKVV